MKREKLILSIFFFSLLQISIAQNNKKENNNSGLTIDTLIEQIKLDPITNYHAAYWFSQLSFIKKREYSEKLGKIVLDDSDSNGFTVAFGSEKSPYPWSFYITKNDFELHADNKFIYIFRNDKYVQKKWGVYWTSEKYVTKINNNSPIFIKNSNTRSQQSDLWIPASGWKYIGPELEKSKDTLNVDKNIINTDGYILSQPKR